MPTDKQLLLAVKILGFLKENYSRGLTIDEIKRLYIKDGSASTYEIQEILTGLETDKFVKQRQSSITKGTTTTSVTMYEITGEGMDRYNLLREASPKVQRAREYQEDYEYEQKKTKQSNRRWLIGCSVGFVLIIAIVIIVATSLG